MLGTLIHNIVCYGVSIMPMRAIFVIKSGLAAGAGAGLMPAMLVADLIVGGKILSAALQSVQVNPQEITVDSKSLRELSEILETDSKSAFAMLVKYAKFQVQESLLSKVPDYDHDGESNKENDFARSKLFEHLSDGQVEALEAVYQHAGFETKISQLFNKGVSYLQSA
jgi:hypothetical protein